MRQIIIVITFIGSLISCTKPDKKPDKILVDLQITHTESPISLLKGQDIISKIKCQAPDLCYMFSHIDSKEVSTRQFEIRAKATYPNDPNVFCAQALYTVDTTVKIHPTSKGQYLLRFYKENQLLQTDTVQVN